MVLRALGITGACVHARVVGCGVRAMSRGGRSARGRELVPSPGGTPLGATLERLSFYSASRVELRHRARPDVTPVQAGTRGPRRRESHGCTKVVGFRPREGPDSSGDPRGAEEPSSRTALSVRPCPPARAEGQGGGGGQGGREEAHGFPALPAPPPSLPPSLVPLPRQPAGLSPLELASRRDDSPIDFQRVRPWSRERQRSG